MLDKCFFAQHPNLLTDPDYELPPTMPQKAGERICHVRTCGLNLKLLLGILNSESVIARKHLAPSCAGLEVSMDEIPPVPDAIQAAFDYQIALDTFD